MKNKEILGRVKEERNILHSIKKRKANLFGHILHRDCFLNHLITGNIDRRIEVIIRGERRQKQLLGDLKKGENTEITSKR